MPLLVGRPFVAPDALDAAVTGSLHDQLLIYSRLIEPAGRGGPQGVIRLVPDDARYLADPGHSVQQRMVA